MYFVENPAWSDYLKVGITTDIDKRLSTYQTGDPHRSYKVAHYDFFIDRRKTEIDVLNKHKLDLSKGEWIKISDSKKMITDLRLTLNVPQGNNKKLVFTVGGASHWQSK